MRHAALPLLLLVALGCEAKPEFANEVDEYRYLSSLANPTPAQWNRKKEIADHPAPQHLQPGTVKDAARALDAFDRIK